MLCVCNEYSDAERTDGDPYITFAEADTSGRLGGIIKTKLMSDKIYSWEPEHSHHESCEFSAKTPANQKVRGQGKNLECPRVILLQRL